MKNNTSIRNKLSWLPYCIWIIPVIIFLGYFLNNYLNNWQASSIAKRVSAGSLVNYYNKADSGIELIRIIDNGIVSGIDVYCNDVHLGRSPVEIKATEFVNKVPKWTTPPRQSRLKMQYSSFIEIATPNFHYEGLLMTYSPCNLLSHSWWRREDNKKEALNSLYWFHFEKDGCVGVESSDGRCLGVGKKRTYTPEVIFCHTESI